jgi:heat shock protein HtpX
MFKRIGLFLVTNLLIIITLSVVMRLLGVDRYFTADGRLDYSNLFVFCLVWGMGGAFISLAISRIVAKWSMGVRVIDPQNPGQFSALVDMVHSMAEKAKLPAMPEVGVYDSPEVNAFATGPTKSRALVAVSTGLLQRMDRDQIEGVVGHEIAHIANGDMVTMTLIQGVVNAFVMFFARIIAWAITQNMRSEMRYMVNFLIITVLEIGLGILGFMVVAWFSRQREFSADRGGAAYAGRGKMISALQGLGRVYGIGTEEEGARGEALATFKISGRKKGGLLSLMSTHPDLSARIAALQAG